MDSRILIKENIELANEIAADLVQFKPVLANFKRAYEAMELGPFSNEIFKTLILTGTSNTIAFYITTLNSQLDKIGITSKKMRENSIAGHDNIIEDLKNALEAAKRFKPTIYSDRATLSLKFISFTDRFVITDEDFDAILESFARTYLSEEEKPFLELAQQLATSYNKLLDVLDKEGVRHYLRLNCLQFVLSIDSNQKVIVDPGKLKGVLSNRERMQQYNAMNLR